MDYEEKIVKELKSIRVQYFWSNDFFINSKKQHFNNKIRYFNLHYLVKGIVVTASLIMINETPDIYPEFLFYSKDLPILLKALYKLGSYTSIGFGIYVSVVHECQCFYNVLHNHFQIVILKEYIRLEMQRLKKMLFENQIDTNVYQRGIRETFKCSTVHYNVLRMLVCKKLICICKNFIFSDTERK